MELTDLKKTWDKLSSNRKLDEGQLKIMLGKHTNNLIERIERNIRIGFIVLFVFFIIIALDEFVISPMMMEEIKLTVPSWLLFLHISYFRDTEAQ